MAHANLMQQNIVATLRRGDEAIPLCEIEPFHLAGDPYRMYLGGWAHRRPFCNHETRTIHFFLPIRPLAALVRGKSRGQMEGKVRLCALSVVA
jgi:hypothetical protein